MSNETVLVRKPISDIKKELETIGVRILKWRYAVPEMKFIDILGMIEPDPIAYQNFYRAHPAFADMPAGAKHHHWWGGGLEDHCKEMIGLGFDLLEMYPGDLTGRITRTDIIIAVFLHDFAKVITYRYISKEEKEKTPNKFLSNQIFTMRQGSFNILDEESWTLLELSKYGITPTEKQWSGVLFAEGGWADANWGPMTRTTPGQNVMAHNPLAVIMHILDMYSSQLLGKSLYVRNNTTFTTEKSNAGEANPQTPSAGSDSGDQERQPLPGTRVSEAAG